ncbi:MAG: PHP domain-containing protein, partial [Kiritimatiellae bacterium]|nr:PHP domain-containing protein [Kiritimatiellia bacterium]
MIDLHIHSSNSDGVLPAAELARRAAAAGLSAAALTDHDTIDGTSAFLEACAEGGAVTGIAGVEFSAASEHGTLHILGLGVDASNQALREALERIRDGRDARNRRILARLNELGYGLTWEEVESFAGGDVMGRPHFARAMIARGWAASLAEVFERFLGRGAPAYVSRFRPAPEEAVALIKGAGGVASVAHPVSWTMDFDDMRASLLRFKEAGLDALECYHPRVGN